MSVSTLMVHMEIDHPNAARVRVAAGLAERFDAVVIGVAACDPQPPSYVDGILPAEVIKADRERARAGMGVAEKALRDGLVGRGNTVEFRAGFDQPTPFVARNARAADLVVTGTNPAGEYRDPFWRLSASELIVQAGRPVLLVPDAVDRLSARRIVVGWKDTREARRAVFDALPFLTRADTVFVAAAVDERALSAAHEDLGDVATWLRRHHVDARTRVVPAVDEAALSLEGLAAEEGADLIVAGAYGHSRFREWITGGVTRDLVGSATVCSLLSH